MNGPRVLGGHSPVQRARGWALDAHRWKPAKLVEEDGYPHRRFPLEHATFLLRCHLMRRGTASPGECYALVPNLRL